MSRSAPNVFTCDAGYQTRVTLEPNAMRIVLRTTHDKFRNGYGETVIGLNHDTAELLAHRLLHLVMKAKANNPDNSGQSEG